MHITTHSAAEFEPMPATNQVPPLISPKAQTILVMGIMGYQRGTLTPYSCHASAAFDDLLAKAKKRGFKASKQLKGAVRRGKATKFAMEKVQMMADFVTDAELAEKAGNAHILGPLKALLSAFIFANVWQAGRAASYGNG